MPMPIPEPVNVTKLLLEGTSFGAQEISELSRAVHRNTREVRQKCAELRERVDAGKPSVRDLTALGVALYFLGQHQPAIGFLEKASGNGVADYYRGQALASLERFDDAIAACASAEKNGFDAIQAILTRAGYIRQAGRIDEAEQLIKANARQAVTRADYSYQMGCIMADRGDTYGAIEYFERAVDMDPHHQRALFRLGHLNATYGNDEEAIQYYERSLSKPPFFLGALINLGLLYEDIERFDAAAFCFRRVLETDPTNERARLYLKDIEAAGDMFFDEEAARRDREQEQVLNTPISDFELSARSRNCLDRLGIRTLGDLTRISEPELLASKNFGETSLKEVRTILESKGLRIGEHLVDKKTSSGPQPVRRDELSEEQRAVYDNPVGDLNLSVRARKCLSKLGIVSIGDLMSRTPDELLSVRNFGVTSLNEIREKLEEMGVSLRND